MKKQIKQIPDLRDEFPEIEALLNEDQKVYFAQSGNDAMGVLSTEEYASFADNVEKKLDEADAMAESVEERLSHDEVFRNARSVICGARVGVVEEN